MLNTPRRYFHRRSFSTVRHNFNAGPGVLPKAVMQKAEQNFVNYQGLGLSVLEMSHRSGEF
jgi:phosphoserine aminotransferase